MKTEDFSSIDLACFILRVFIFFQKKKKREIKNFIIKMKIYIYKILA
jgi:hypothetical protein